MSPETFCSDIWTKAGSKVPPFLLFSELIRERGGGP